MTFRDHFSTLKSVFESASDPICSLDRNYRYTSFNKAHVETMKKVYGACVRIGGNHLDCISVEKERRQTKRKVDLALRGKRAVLRSLRSRITYTPLRNETGAVRGVALFASALPRTSAGKSSAPRRAPGGREVPGKSGTDVLLQKTNDVLRAIIDAAPTAIIGLNLEGRVEKVWNRAAEKMLGWSASEVMGQFLPSVPRENETEFEQFRGQIRQGMTLDGVEVRRTRRDGTPIDYSIYASPLHDQAGNISGNIAVLVDITERKRAKTALQESEEKFRSIVENALAGIYTVDDEYRFVYVNDELCRLLGRSREEILGKDFRGFLPDGVREVVADRYVRRQRGEHLPARYELDVVRENGEIRHAEMTVAVVQDAAGKRRSMGQLVDITERKRAEQTLQMFQYTIDQAFDAVFWINREAGFSYVNEQACRSLGYTREELMQLSLWDIDPIYPKERWDTNWEHYQEGRHGGGEQVETFHRRKDGTTFPVEVSSQHLWFGEHELHVAVVRDITERKQAEQALQAKTDELDRYFTSSLDLLCIADTDGYFRRLNPEWEKTLGYTVSELEGKRFLGLVHPDDLDSTVATISRLQQQVEVLNFENRYRCKDGSYRWIEWRSYPRGKMIYAVARDVTERRKAEEALRTSLSEKEVLLKEIHHRVKNNLQIIASMLHLQAEHSTDERILTQFREAQNRVLSIAMVHQKLYGSTNLAEINFSEYLHDFIGGLFRAYGDTRAKLTLDLEDTRLGIDVAIPCGLIINELVTNALKYAFPQGREGTISLSLHADGPADCVLTVRDDGVGIPERTDPFQGDTLGMTLVSILVQQLGGTIELEKTQGTRFVIRFKRSPA